MSIELAKSCGALISAENKCVAIGEYTEIIFDDEQLAAYEAAIVERERTIRDEYKGEAVGLLSEMPVVTVEQIVRFRNASLDREKELLAEIEHLTKVIEEAADNIEHWGAYASDYFKDKWNLQGDISKIRAEIEGLKGEK